MSDRKRLSRLAGILYALNFVLGIAAMVLTRQRHVAAADWLTVAGAVEYAVVVMLLGVLFSDDDRALSWAVAAVGLVGCVTGVSAGLHAAGSTADALVVFGFYCVGLGILVIRSSRVPLLIGALLIIAGLGWLTYADRSLAHVTQPYNMAAGILGELAFTIWLISSGFANRSRVTS